MNGNDAMLLEQEAEMRQEAKLQGDGITVPMRFPRLYNDVERCDSARHVVDALLEEHDPLQAHVMLKQAIAILDAAMNLNKDKAILTMTEKQTSVFGAKVEQRRTPAKWEYPKNDSELSALEEKKKEVDTNLKARKKFLELLKEELVDPKSGEIVQPATQVYPGGVTVAVTLPD